MALDSRVAKGIVPPLKEKEDRTEDMLKIKIDQAFMIMKKSKIISRKD